MPETKKPTLRAKESDDIKKAWKNDEENETYDRTVAYVKNLLSHMDNMEKNRFQLPEKQEDIEGDEEFKKFALQ